MRIIFMGTPDFAVPALKAIAAWHEVVAVYSQPPRAAGRGQKPRPGPVQKVAEDLGLPVRTPLRLRDAAEQAEFASFGADLAVVAAYGLILPQPVLDAPRLGCLNIHASILPRWRGAAPIHRAVLAGDAETGVAIMQMEAGLDTGPVLAEARTRIGPEDTTGALHDRLAEMGAALMVEVLEKLPMQATPQPDSGITYAEKIDKAESRIDWSAPAEVVDRQIRGLSPFPGAWTMAGDERIKLLRSRIAEGEGQPGQVLHGFTIACGSGAVEVMEAQRPGKRAMKADEVLRGLDLPDQLG